MFRLPFRYPRVSGNITRDCLALSYGAFYPRVKP